jgi:hypothetical protein
MNGRSTQMQRDRSFKRYRPIPTGSPAETEKSILQTLQEAKAGKAQVSFALILRARYWQSHHSPFARRWRQLGDKYAGPLLAEFERANPNVQMSIFGRSGLGAYISKDAGLQFVIMANALRFDWLEAQTLVNRVNEVGERANAWWGSIAEPPRRTPQRGQVGSERSKEWIRRFVSRRKKADANAERQRLLDVCLGAMSAVFAAVDRENPHDLRTAMVQRSACYERAMSALTERIASIETNLDDSLQRSAQMFYGRGMARGVLVLAVLAGAIGAVFDHYGVPAQYGVAFPAGAIGAALSVLQRMGTKNADRRMALDPNAGQRLLPFYGAARAIVGGVLGYAVFVFLKGGLFPALKVQTSAPLATFAAFGFLGGLNERWAQDMIAGSAARLSQDSG